MPYDWHAPPYTVRPREWASLTTSATSRDLPRPASPTMPTIWPRPWRACSSRSVEIADAAARAGKEDQGFLEGRIQQIEAMLRQAVLIEENGPSDSVRIGSRVTVVEEGLDEAETFRLVGAAEANPLNGTISNESPLGQALLGREVDDTVAVETPGGETTFRIAAIE